MQPKRFRLIYNLLFCFTVIAILPMAAFAQDEPEAPDAPDAVGGDGEDNPTGVSGIHNGNVTTAGSYDPHTGNAMREVDDIVVPGSVGAYPLKWTRYFNSHCTRNNTSTGGRWRFAYLDYSYDAVGIMFFPDGRALNFRHSLYGVPEFTEGGPTGQTLHLADGGRVILPHVDSNYLKASKIIDPYGFETTIVTTGSGSSKTTKITEPGHRYLLVSYNSDETVHSVQAFDGVSSTPTQIVTYTWTNSDDLPGNHFPNGPYALLTHVDYGDGTSADYGYDERHYKGPVEGCGTNPHSTHRYAAVLKTCDDSRFTGPMSRIAYTYQLNSGNGTRITSEKRLLSNGAEGETVSSVSLGNSNGAATETRGDGPARAFYYSRGCRNPVHCPPPGAEGGDEGCPEPEPLDGKLRDYTDFYTGNVSNAHTTHLDYEEDKDKPSAGYIKAVTNFNLKTTQYIRSDSSWGIIKIIYPPTPTEPQGSFIEQAFTDDVHPYFLQWRKDERQNKVVYTRNSSIPNAITRKDYQDDTGVLVAFETFDYNERGQILTHRRKNGSYQHFDFGTDTRGLLMAKTNPTWNPNRANSLASEPKTTYTYYTASDFGGVWTDRVKTETDPRGLATEYEYDRRPDYTNPAFPNGQSIGNPCPGRGLVTKLKHVSDNNTYQLFAFDKYGNKVWEENELRQRTVYEYDEYNRVIRTTDPINHATQHSYQPWNQTSSYVTTTKQPFVTTLLPEGEVTNSYYDVNWRKTRDQKAPNTAVEANTYFYYDNVGNVKKVTDPNNHSILTDYDERNRKVQVTDPLGHVTTFGYDAASNVKRITHPDGSFETKTYGPFNRVETTTVPKAGPAASPTETITTTFEYYPVNMQSAGALWHVIVPQSSTVNLTTTLEYDPSGLKTKMIYPNNTDYQSWTYDVDKNLIARRTVNNASQYFAFDNRNRQVGMSWSDAADWATFGYDDAGRMTSAQNPSSQVTREYDNAGRLTHDRQKPRLQPVSAVSRKLHGDTAPVPYDIALPLSGTAGVECRTGGTNNSHQIVITFPRAVTFSGASITTGTATVAGAPGLGSNGKQITINLTGVSNAQSIVVTLSGVSDGTITNDVKIGMSVLLGDVTGNGVVTSSDVSQTQYSSGQPLNGSNFRQDVNLNGAINSTDVSTVQAQSGTGTSLTLPEQPGSNAPEVDVQYAYDNSSRQTGLYVPGASYNYTFSYDQQGRFEKILSGGALKFQYGYDAASNEVLRHNQSNGVDQVYGRDELNRMTNRDLVRAGSTIAYETYGYDLNRPGLLTSVDRNDGKRDAFFYDLLPELTSAQYGLQQGVASAEVGFVGEVDPKGFGDGSKEGDDGGGEKLIEPDPDTGTWVHPERVVSYTWDKAGNRANMNENITGGASTSTAYQVTSLNQYWQVGTDAVTNGSHHELSTYQDIAYSYINDTHLCAITGGNHTYQLSYDALGRCVVRMFDSVTNYYIYDGEKAILEYSTGNHLLAANLYGREIDEILQRTDYSGTSAHTWYYQDDHEGSITQLTDTNGNIVESYRYDAFGKPAFWNADNQQIQGTNFNNRFLFTGREYVASFGVYEYRNRAYHPGLGRFMSEDPKLDADPTNLFRYCHNDPIDFADPMGLDVVPSDPDKWAVKMDVTGSHIPVSKDKLIATRQLVGLSTTRALAFLSAKANGQFKVDADPVSVNKGGIGASGSNVEIGYQADSGQGSGRYTLDQEISSGPAGRDGQVNWGPFGPDRAENGRPEFKVTPGVNSAKINDKPGKWSEDFKSRPGSAIQHSGQYPAAHFAPFGERIRVSAYRIGAGGKLEYQGSHVWSAVYREGHLPRYEGTGRDWYPAEF
jgi:RHS repeat-associated protein